MIPEYTISFSIKNNILLSAMKECGFNTIKDFINICNVSQSQVSDYINLEEHPYDSKGLSFKKSIVKIAMALDREPEDLFPKNYLDKVINKLQIKNSLFIEMYTSYISSLIGKESGNYNFLENTVLKKERISKLGNILKSLTSREQKVIKMRFGVDTSFSREQCAKKLKITKQGLVFIEKRALNKLKKKIIILENPFKIER